MEITIDGKKYLAKAGNTILAVCRNNNIPIPTLCSFEGLPREQVCRLCLVEINKSKRLVTACNFQVCDGLEVVTRSEKVEKARKINMELLWADHGGKCSGCSKNLRCELQKMAQEYQVENFHFIPRKGEITHIEEVDLIKDNKTRATFDDRNPAIRKTGELCVECRRCINICPTKEWGFNYRGSRATVSTPYGRKLECMMCGQCVRVCPTASLDDNSDVNTILEKVRDTERYTIAVVDPWIFESIRLEISQCSGLGEMKKILSEIGFEEIFSLDDVWEEYFNILLSEVMKTENVVYWLDCCPAFVWQAKNSKKNIRMLPVESPEKIAVKKIKEICRRKKINSQAIDIFLLSPCTAKKAFPLPEFSGVISVKEFGRLQRLNNKKDEINTNYKKNGVEGKRTSSDYNPGNISQKLKNLIANQDNIDFKTVCGWKEICDLLSNRRETRNKKIIIEGWICPGGCAGGGGQSYLTD